MKLSPGIYDRGTVNYDAIEAVNISSLVWIGKSPKHYKHHPSQTTKPMSLGTAAHVATLEPHRFSDEFAIWDRRAESGKLCPRNGKHWDAFKSLNAGKIVITDDEKNDAIDIASAVRGDDVCCQVLDHGSPEVTLVWVHERTGILCKGRVDWIDIELRTMFADLKTAADISPGPFMNKAAKLLYHARMAWYHDAVRQLTGLGESDELETLIVAVESGKPHDCAVYWIDDDVLDAGRDEYERMLDRLQSSIATNTWNGIADGCRMRYTLPRWAVDDPEDEMDPELDWRKANERDAQAETCEL